MTTLFMTVWEDAAEVALGDPIQTANVAIGGASAPLTAVTGSGRKRVRLFAASNCYVNWGDGDPAAATEIPMGSENPEYFEIDGGQIISVIERV